MLAIKRYTSMSINDMINQNNVISTLIIYYNDNTATCVGDSMMFHQYLLPGRWQDRTELY